MLRAYLRSPQRSWRNRISAEIPRTVPRPHHTTGPVRSAAASATICTCPAGALYPFYSSHVLFPDLPGMDLSDDGTLKAKEDEKSSWCGLCIEKVGFTM